jgi:hypothetical protein
MDGIDVPVSVQYAIGRGHRVRRPVKKSCGDFPRPSNYDDSSGLSSRALSWLDAVWNTLMTVKTMKKPALYGSACAAAVVLGALTGMALAQPSQQPSCGKFQLVLLPDHISYVDAGKAGVTVGDRRILSWQIKDKEGKPIGTQYTISTVMPGAPSDSYRVMADSVIAFDTGTLKVSALAPLRDPLDTGKSTDVDLEWTVQGGTGDFAGATGTVKTVPLGDGTYEIAFDLACAKQ